MLKLCSSCLVPTLVAPSKVSSIPPVVWLTSACLSPVSTTSSTLSAVLVPSCNVCVSTLLHALPDRINVFMFFCLFYSLPLMLCFQDRSRCLHYHSHPCLRDDVGLALSFRRIPQPTNPPPTPSSSAITLSIAPFMSVSVSYSPVAPSCSPKEGAHYIRTTVLLYYVSSPLH